MQDVFLTLPNGTVIRDRYVIEDLLGKGGFGSVYLVRDKRVKGNLFALKEVVDPSKQERDRFTLECEILRRLDHPALPHVYRAFNDDAAFRAYMLMDYIEGPNLEVLRQRQPQWRLPLAEVLNIMAPIIAAISYLHSQQPPIIHRDIKPSNIIVSATGDETVLVDFGIAKEYEPDSTTTTVRRCSPGYGAPEQYSGGTDSRTDVYGIAATLYAVLTGKVPADAFQRMLQLGSKGIDPLIPVLEVVPGIPPTVSETISKAMSINGIDRFATIEEFWQALHAGLPADVKAEASVQSLVLSAALSSPALAGNGLSLSTAGEEVESSPGEEIASPAKAGSVISTDALQGSDIRARTEDATIVAQRNSPPAVTPVLAALQEPTFRLVKVPTYSIRRKIVVLGLFLLIVMIGIGMAASYWSSAVQHTLESVSRQGTAHSVARLTQVAVRTPAHTAIVPTVTSIVPTVTATATPVTAQNIPHLAGTYQGTLTNTATSQYSHMVVVITQIAGHATFNGQLTLNRILGGISSFTGVVDDDNNFSFTIKVPAGQMPLHFYGVVQDGVYLHGNYCISSTNHCAQSTGYFTIGPRY